jgi:hypothetical protein
VLRARRVGFNVLLDSEVSWDIQAVGLSQIGRGTCGGADPYPRQRGPRGEARH